LNSLNGVSNVHSYLQDDEVSVFATVVESIEFSLNYGEIDVENRNVITKISSQLANKIKTESLKASPNRDYLAFMDELQQSANRCLAYIEISGVQNRAAFRFGQLPQGRSVFL
jgi:hypothetical protein